MNQESYIEIPRAELVDPWIHIKRRRFLPAGYRPQPCWLCQDPCDLCGTNAMLMFAFGVPVGCHRTCANRPELWDGDDQHKWAMLAAEAVVWEAFPAGRAFEVPAGFYDRLPIE